MSLEGKKRSVAKTLSMLTLLLIIGLITIGIYAEFSYSRLVKPFVRFSQWRRINYPELPDERCYESLRLRGIDFRETTIPDNWRQMGCEVSSPIVGFNLGLALKNIAYEPALDRVPLSCELARKLEEFIRTVIVPQSQRYFERPPLAILHKGGFSCRSQRGDSAILSDHAFGDAFDFAGLEFEGGGVILLQSASEGSREANFFREVGLLSCAHFGTVLGPGYNEFHRDHFHWSIGFPSMCQL